MTIEGREVLVGIQSFSTHGEPCSFGDPNYDKDRRVVYTSVYYFREWIQTTITNNR